MQFYAYANTNPASKSQYPYLLDIQNDLLSDLNTRVVIPLTPAANLPAGNISKLCPLVDVNGENYAVMTQQMAGIESRLLGKNVADLSACRDVLIAAVDFLVVGF